MFELSGVSKTYGPVAALRPLDLGVRAGTTTVLIGPSGCGKSTVLRLMNGLVTPDTGSVRFAGTPLDTSNASMLRRRMGYVIQEGGLFPHLTAAANVTLMSRHVGWSRERSMARLADMCEMTRFPADGLTRYPAQLSGGQRQRVSLMRALMLDPDALLLDEPLGALDPMVRYDLQGELHDIFRTLGKTVVLVTHDLSEAAFFGDDIVLMRDGAIEQRGEMDDLLVRPASGFVERFVRAQRGLSNPAESRS
tara:strand:- start:18 stop:767 length:750 start_codon:yes stop_codon:yes gene_type:complete